MLHEKNAIVSRHFQGIFWKHLFLLENEEVKKCSICRKSHKCTLYNKYYINYFVCFPALFPRSFTSTFLKELTWLMLFLVVGRKQFWVTNIIFRKYSLPLGWNLSDICITNFTNHIFRKLRSLNFRNIFRIKWYHCFSFQISDLPDEGPIIEGAYPRYHIGDKVQINCTSHRSKPVAKLRWYINGEQADKQNVKMYKVLYWSFYDNSIIIKMLSFK